MQCSVHLSHFTDMLVLVNETYELAEKECVFKCIGAIKATTNLRLPI